MPLEFQHIALARSMGCRPSQVLQEDELDILLWNIYANKLAEVQKRHEPSPHRSPWE